MQCVRAFVATLKESSARKMIVSTTFLGWDPSLMLLEICAKTYLILDVDAGQVSRSLNLPLDSRSTPRLSSPFEIKYNNSPETEIHPMLTRH